MNISGKTSNTNVSLIMEEQYRLKATILPVNAVIDMAINIESLPKIIQPTFFESISLIKPKAV